MSAKQHAFGDHRHSGGARKRKGYKRRIRRQMAKLLRLSVVQPRGVGAGWPECVVCSRRHDPTGACPRGKAA
jgi:hypothetical protein